MPASGGQSTAHGIRYEAWAVVYELTDVLAGSSDWVRPQAQSVGVVPGSPSISPVVDDYIVCRKGTRFYHSAKHSAPGWGRWTILRLIKEGVLDQFARQHREDPDAQLVLTTQSASPFLGELCSRAGRSQTLQELREDRFTKELSQDWDRALHYLQWGEDDLFALCRKMSLQFLTIDETERNVLRWLRESFAQAEGLPELLLRLALDAAAEGRHLDREAILEWLQERGIYLVTPVSTGVLLDAVRQAGASLRQYPNEIAGVHLERSEVTDLVDWALRGDSNEKVAMLLDVYGGGKTVILGDVLLALEKADVPTLAIKADVLSGIERAGDLKAALRLPGDVEEVMAQLAARGRAIAIVDQLDALSLTLSREQGALDVMLDTIARLRGIAGVRIIAACRTFDLNTDPKLSQVNIDRRISPRLLTQGQMGQVLQAAEVESTSLLPSLQELLRNPQNLKVFVDVVEARRANLKEGNDQLVDAVGGFTSLQDLYSELWRQKVALAPRGAPPAEKMVAAIDVLVDYMHQNRRVSAPEPLLDSHIDGAKYLEQQDMLRRDGGLWFFSHQTLYDYCYARRFIRRGQSLHDEILAGDQGLFVRSEMIQILAYLRHADFQAYRLEFESLLFRTGRPLWLMSLLQTRLGCAVLRVLPGLSKDLRYHLRLLLLQWFGAVPDPRPEELSLAGRLLRDDDQRWDCLRGMMGNGAWFDLLDEEWLDELLRHEDEQVTQEVAAYLESMVNVRTRRVLERLQRRLGQTESWDTYVSTCLAELHDWSNRDALDMLVSLVTRGRIESWLREECMVNLAKTSPAGACVAARAYLDRRLSEWLCSATDESDVLALDPNGILPTGNEGYFLSETLADLSEACPTDFLVEILPWVCQIAERLARPSRAEVYHIDPLFSWGWQGQGLSTGKELIGACRTALRSLAVEQPAHLRTIADDLAHSQLYCMHRLLARAYVADPEAYAGDIFAYLSADTRRLHLGDLDAPYYDSHQLIAAAFPRLTPEQRAKLESMILAYESQWERTTVGAWGSGQFQLLQAIQPGLLSGEAHLRLLQLQRKFPGRGIGVPHGITGGFVGPPIDQQARARMTDEAWLGAMGKYDDSTEWASPGKEFLKGGVIELSRALEEHTKAEPKRFYKLALKFDESISSYYVGAVIAGIAESDAPADYVFDLARRFVPRIDRQVRMEVCRALSRRATDGVPDDLLAAMRDYATTDRDPDRELWSEASPHGDPWYGADPHHHGINTVRGAAVGDLCRCALMRDPPQVEVVFRALDDVVNDPSTAVRACAVDSLVYLFQYDKVRAIGLFERAVDGHEALLRCQPAQRVLYYAYQSHFSRLKRFIDAMMRDHDEAVRQTGAVLACLAAFSHAGAGDMAERAICGDAALRRGAAHVYAVNVGNLRLEERCLTRLVRMLNDGDQQVREAIGDCFDQLRGDHIPRLRPFIRDFLSSRALPEGAFKLVTYLRAHVTEDPELALEAVQQILAGLGEGLTDMTKAAGRLPRELVPITLSVYAHSRDPKQRGRAMDLFEQLLASGSYVARAALADYDRR
jgi:hypothetical protein